MECPICGEALALNDKECPACGAPADRLFLTEEVEASRIRERTFNPPEEEDGVLRGDGKPKGLKGLLRKKNGSRKSAKNTNWR